MVMNEGESVSAVASPSSSQASSRIVLEPIPATIIAEVESRRRDANRDLGPCQSGCSEVDDSALLGGLERGSVVGVSSEDESFGVTLAIQVLAHGLCAGNLRTAHVITPKPRNVILAAIRDGIQTQLKTESATLGDDDMRRRTRALLERVMLSCVFDMEGVWEVVAGLDRRASPAVSVPGRGVGREEIGDSQDEEEEEEEEAAGDVGPDIVVMTHFGSLMTGLFTHRSSSSAHQMVQSLSLHLRHLSRSLPSSPLILLLNSTASSSSSGADSKMMDSGPGNSPNKLTTRGVTTGKPLDPTLRSIFNPPYIPGYAGQSHHPAAMALSRRNKPTFGLVFSQMLDVHVLCTRVPRTEGDADRVYGLAADTRGGGEAEYATVVEVLLDEMGVWPSTEESRRGVQGTAGGGSTRATRQGRLNQKRRCREQRWGAVMVRGGRVVDAFVSKSRSAGGKTDEVRVVGGFGGPRV